MSTLFSSRSRSLVALLALALVGCGGKYRGNAAGTGGNTNQGSARLVFSNPSNYNGTSATLTGTPAGSGINTGYNIVLSNGDRFFEVGFPIDDLANGTTINLAGDSPAVAIYEEGENNSLTWKATSGTLTVSNVTSDGKATVKLTGVQFSPSDVFGPFTSTGTFQLDGTLTVVPFTGGDD